MKKYDFHEYANLFPMMDDNTFNSFVTDIKNVGLHDKIIMIYEDKILDGRNRYRACQVLNIEPDFKKYIGRDPLGYVLSLNLERRHLTESQKATVAVEILPLIEMEAKKRMSMGGKGVERIPPLNQRKSRDDAAKVVGVNPHYVSDAKKLKKEEPELFEKVKKGTITLPEAFKEKKKTDRKKLAEQGKNIILTSEDIDLRFGDFKQLLQDIPDNSIDLILTDPPYPYEYIEFWSDLSNLASRVLKSSGFCVVYSGQMHLPEVMQRLNENLQYYWTFCLYHEGKTQIVNGVNLICRWKPVLIYQKFPRKKLEITTQDYVINSIREKGQHDWQQGEDGVKKLIEIFSEPGDIILDPFAGTATILSCAKKLKRKSIGCEIEEQTFNIAKKRLNEVQPQ